MRGTALSGSTKTIIRITWNQLFGGRPKTFDQRTDPAWYQYRWELWKQYTEPSLLRQTHEDFEAWLLCDPELREYTDWMTMPDSRFKLVYDRNAEAKKLKADRYLFVRIDNDDVYCDTALQEFNKTETDKEYIQFSEGWVLNHETRQLAEWRNPSPAFVCKIGGSGMFAKRMPGMIQHGKVKDVAHIIRGKKFVVVAHGNNVCNQFRGRFIGPEVEGEEKANAFAEFGLEKIDGKSGNSQ